MTTCPLCFGDIPAAALVCSGCGRDVAVPPELIEERDALLAKRDELRGAIADVQARIAQRRRR